MSLKSEEKGIEIEFILKTLLAGGKLKLINYGTLSLSNLRIYSKTVNMA